MNKECPECSYEFPAQLIWSLITNEGTFECCPICSLKICRSIHGEGFNFIGEKARKAYKLAVKLKGGVGK